MLLIILFLTTILPGRIYGFEVGSGDEVGVDLCKLPDGVFPDPDSCENFIRCQSGVPDVEPCPDSLLFNPLKLTCDFSKTGNCSEPEDFDETSTPVETNDVVCSEDGPNVYPIQSSFTEYYMCDNDTAFKVKCPKDLLMNADKLTCDYPENVDCDSVSSPEESTVGMKAVYEDDDKDLESETKTSVTFSSTDTSSPSAEPAVQIKSETDFDSKEMTGYTLNEPEETTSAKLDATGNVISDKSVSPNPEITSTYGYLDENITSKISTLKETSLPKQEDSSFEVKPTQTNSDQDITVKTSVFTSTSNVNDEVISSTSDAHRERSNLEDSTTENNARDILTSPDTTVTDLSSNTFHDFTSSESSEQSLGDKSVTTIQTPDDKDINDTGSGSDIDIINIFTTYSNNASQQLDVSTNDVSTSNSLISAVTNEHNLNTKASSSDKSITSDSLSGTLENVSTLDSEVELTTKTTDLEKSEGTSTETTKSEVSLSASYELTSQTDVTDNKSSVDNVTSVVKSTETIVTDSNFNESTTRSSVLTSLGLLEDIKNESYFQDTTKIPTVVEADKIDPEKTLTTNPSLMSSDPLTDNETTKITTSTFSESVKVTPKYMTNTATTEEHPSFDAETSESTSLSDDQNEEYEVFTESVVESNWTLTPESNFFTELSTVGLEHIVSSQPTATSIISDVNTEILDINDITSEDTISNKQSSLSNEVSTSSLLQQNSDSTSKSHFINEVINTEAITSSENISSGHISENVVVETHDYISSETTSPVSTEMDNLTESVINVETVMSHSTYLTSENQNPTLTSTHLKLTTGDDLITASHLPTRQNTKVTEIASVEISDMLYSTSVSTEHPTNTNAFSGSTNSGDNDIDLQMSSLKTQQPDETTEKIDLSSESDVTKVDQTYIDMYTNNSTSSLENSSDESFAASTADLESLTYNSSSAGTSENLKLGSSEVVISSVSERFQSTHTESSSDLTTTLLHTRTEVADISVTNEQTSEDDFDSSKSTSKNTRINSKETELPYKIQSSTLSEVLTNFSGSEVVTSTKESLSSDLMTSLHHQSEKSTQISETGMDFGGITLSTSGVTDPENILTTENKGTSTDVSSDTLNDATTTVFIHTSSNTIAGNASETILSSTGQIDDSTQSSLPKNTDIFEITSDSLGPGSVTRPGATLTSSEITENLKLVSTDSYTLQNNSTESTTEINKTPNISKETSKAFVSNSTVSNTVIDVGTTSSIENITNMYEESSTSNATDPFKNTSVVTVSSFIEVTNETSESFWPETKEIATENNRASILHASTTITGLISDTIQSTISEVTSIASTTDMDGETTSSDISSSAVSYSKDSFASTSAIATKQNYISTLSTLQIATSEDSTSDSSTSTHMILPITYFNDSDNSISTIDEASESPKYDSNNVTETSTSVITSTKDYSSDENTSLANVKSTKEAPMIQVTTEFISTKLNSEEPDAYETSQFTGRRFEESSPNSQTNFDIVSRNTLSTEWPTKSTTGVQSIPSDSISSDESTSDITSSDVMTESTFKTSGTSTKTTTYKETSEPETVSKDNTFPSPGNLVSSTDTLFESTSLSSLKVTSETTSKPITETSRDITDGNILSTSSNISIYSSEIDSSTVDPTKISESTDLFTDFKRETVPMTAETDGDLSTNDETESTDSIIKIISTSTSKFATEISKDSTIDITSFSRIIATEIGNPFSITATTKGNNLINDRTTETTPKTSNTDSISIYSKTLPEDKGETDSSTVDPTKISESTDLFTDSKRETVPTTTETGGGLSTKDETESTDSIIKIQSTSTATSKFATEISRESTIDTTSFSRIIATETGNPFPITATTRDTTKGNNLINDRTETTPKTSNTDSISISSKTLPEDKGETDSSTVDPTKISESTDLSTDSKLETVPTTVETDGGLSTKDKTESTHSIIKILSTSTATSKFATEISRESTTHTTSFSRIIATETGNPFPITATTRDTTKENNLINDRTTETHQKTSNTDSISIASKTLPEDKGETDHIFSTTDSSVVKTTVMKTSSKVISESDLQPMSTTEMSVLINDTNERLTESNTDFTSVSMASRNLEEETNSIDYSSTTYFPSDLRTETSHSSPNTDIESENKEISATDMSSSGTTVTKTHSKDISESDLPVVPTTETTLLIFNYTNKTTTESITDVSNVSITSRNIIGKTESTEDPSTTYIPAAFRTETSVSSANTDTESEFQRISSTDIPSESTTTVNPICVTSEGSFPYPDDCNKFYRCTKGVPVQSSCVGNEHFDPVKRICTNPCLAKCDPNADCGTTESKTNAEETTSSQTMSSKGVSSTSELYNTGTEETSVATTPDDFIEDTTPNKISKSTSEETSTITNSAFRSSILESTTEKLGTDYFTSDESPPSVADINATKDLTEISSDDYMSTRTFENVTTSDDFNQISSDVPITSTTVTNEIPPETQTEVFEVSSSTTKTSTETSSSISSEFTVTTDITPESSGDGEDSSSTSTLITSTKCENGDCLSSKSATSATLVPFRLCHRNDFLSQPKCSEYLDCTGKEPKILVCPNGLHFNPSTRVCDWPYSAECGTSPKPLYEPTDLLKCPCKSCLIPSTKSCSHYYLCIGFTAYEMKCSNSLYFDRIRNTCNYAPLVDCSHLTSTSTTTEIEPTESSTKTSTFEISTSTRASTTPASFVCPSQEGLFRYPGNCGMFYQCANWYPYVMNCAATTHFSEITQRCEYPCDAKCDLTLNCGISSTAPPSDPRCSCNNCRLPSPDSCTKYITCVNGRARIEYCPWGKTFDARRSTCDWAHKVTCHPSAMCPQRNGLFSHKDDCHKFVHCSNGIPYVKNCPSILEFDPIKKRCEWPNGRCNYLPINTRDVDYKNVEHRKGWKCPKIFGYYPVDQHCNKFYYCSFGTPTLKECSPGLLYNPRYQTCDWKKQVRCNSNRHLKPRKCRVFDHHVVCSEDRRPKLHVLCNMYYDCTAGRACAKQCPVGLYFNNMTGVCDLPENVKCLNHGEGDYSLKELSVKCASGDHGRQVNPTNDSCFYHCRQGKVVSGCCSKGHVYNVHKDKCERRTKSLRI